MKPYFATGGVPGALLASTLVFWVVMETVQSRKGRAGASSDDRGSVLILRAGYVLALTLANVAATKTKGTAVSRGAISFGIGIAMMWGGIALRLWSFRTLGSYFTFRVMTSPEQAVISTGPYHYLRHPGYLGVVTILVGLGATYANWLSLAALGLVPIAGIISRIRVEEAALTRTLGNAYTSYAASHKRLIPFVW